jgi:hypothetical protein
VPLGQDASQTTSVCVGANLCEVEYIALLSYGKAEQGIRVSFLRDHEGQRKQAGVGGPIHVRG